MGIWRIIPSMLRVSRLFKNIEYIKKQKSKYVLEMQKDKEYSEYEEFLKYSQYESFHDHE